MKVSIILLDWSVRESFHVLKYLNEQTLPRSEYQIVWVEFYDRPAPRQFRIDQHVAMKRGSVEHYHKHQAYNAGLLASQGQIAVICDSDAMVKPTFLASIVDIMSPPHNPKMVLHLDEVRSQNQKFYPFRYPTFEQIQAPPSNWDKNTTRGMNATSDLIHARNYGACMAAYRNDLFRIGGADEHEDYRGHICGPYEMTFRLRNAGFSEVWHPTEFLYHAWHPGQDGKAANVKKGPHDGRMMSRRALDLLESHRVMPWVENPRIRLCRRSLSARTQD